MTNDKFMVCHLSLSNYSLVSFSAVAVLLARPSFTASVMYESTLSIDFEASSLAGIAKST